MLRIGHERATAVPDVDESPCGESRDRFSHRCPTDAQLLSELALCGETLSRAKSSVDDQLDQLPHDLVFQTVPSYRLKYLSHNQDLPLICFVYAMECNLVAK